MSVVLTSLSLLPEAQHTRQNFLRLSVQYTCHVSGGKSSASLGRSRGSLIVRPCGIYGEQGYTRTGFSPSLSGFLGRYHSIGGPSAFIRSSPNWTIAALVSAGKMSPSSYPSNDCSLYSIFRHPKLRSLYRSLTPWLPHLKSPGFL